MPADTTPCGRLRQMDTPLWGKYGQGRVWAVADTGWLSNGALLGGGLGGIKTDQDNWEIMLRLTHWVAALDTAKP